MKISIEPTVVLVARPSIEWRGIEKALKGMGYEAGLSEWAHGTDDQESYDDGDKLPEFMGRLCYGSFGPRQGRVGANDYIKNILSQGHGSVLEHACWSFVVLGASRGHLAQLTRHRAGFSFSAESTHFIRYGEGPGRQTPVVCLNGLDGDAFEVATKAIEGLLDAYGKAWDEIVGQAEEDGIPPLKKKQIAGVARSLLPNAMEAKVGFTANSRALRHFIELRGAEDNVPEIRYVAAQVATIMQVEARATFADAWVKIGKDGHPIAGTDRRKV